MAHLEDNVLFKTWTGTRPHLWRRYIDDVLFFWNGRAEELTKFLGHLNEQHEYIKFTATYDIASRSVPFLDMTVSIDDENTIQTDLYKKDTAVCQYLLPSSCHPGHVTSNIPYSLGYRCLRICSSPENFENALESLKTDLIARQYSPKIIHDAFVRVRKVPREQALLRVKKKENDRKPPLVITYHPCLPPVAKLVRKHWEVMTQERPDLMKIFKNPSVVAYRRSKNLRDLLVRAKLPTRKSDRDTGGFQPCNRYCVLCKVSGSHTTHTNRVTGETWKIHSNMPCLTKNVVYKIECRLCPDFLYIGETGRRFCDRIQDHRQYVYKKDQTQPMGRHFSQPGHDWRHMVPFAIEEVIPKNDPMLRKQREKIWIRNYDAVNQGANTRF